MAHRVRARGWRPGDRARSSVRMAGWVRDSVSEGQRVVVLGGGPGGYEAALVAAQLGADVTVVERDGLGGAAVLTDVVPSKTLIATAEVMALVGESVELGVRFPGGSAPDGGSERESEREPAAAVSVDLGAVNRRGRAPAPAPSHDRPAPP